MPYARTVKTGCAIHARMQYRRTDTTWRQFPVTYPSSPTDAFGESHPTAIPPHPPHLRWITAGTVLKATKKTPWEVYASRVQQGCHTTTHSTMRCIKAPPPTPAWHADAQTGISSQGIAPSQPISSAIYAHALRDIIYQQGRAQLASHSTTPTTRRRAHDVSRRPSANQASLFSQDCVPERRGFRMPA